MYQAIVIGASAGGWKALREIITYLDKNFSIPILIVQHIHPHNDNMLPKYLKEMSHLKVKEAEEKETVKAPVIYLAPANYHLIVEEDKTMSLSTEDRVNDYRPSIDVLFDSAADVYGPNLIGIVLTGANSDGTNGMLKIKEKGGLLIVQNPKTAVASTMPLSVIKQTEVDYILTLSEISEFLNKISTTH